MSASGTCRTARLTLLCSRIQRRRRSGERLDGTLYILVGRKQRTTPLLSAKASLLELRLAEWKFRTLTLLFLQEITENTCGPARAADGELRLTTWQQTLKACPKTLIYCSRTYARTPRKLTNTKRALSELATKAAHVCAQSPPLSHRARCLSPKACPAARQAAPREPGSLSYFPTFFLTRIQEPGHRSLADKLGARFGERGFDGREGRRWATLWRLTDAPINAHGDLVTKGMFQISRCSGRRIIPPPRDRSHAWKIA